MDFPKYFTPNNDGFNDFWQVYGVDQELNSDINVKIFDRYGKLLATINPLGSGWDGTFNGNLLPTNDYWHTATLGNGTSFSGHFTLKR